MNKSTRAPYLIRTPLKSRGGNELILVVAGFEGLGCQHFHPTFKLAQGSEMQKTISTMNDEELEHVIINFIAHSNRQQFGRSKGKGASISSRVWKAAFGNRGLRTREGLLQKNKIGCDRSYQNSRTSDTGRGNTMTWWVKKPGRKMVEPRTFETLEWLAKKLTRPGDRMCDLRCNDGRVLSIPLCMTKGQEYSRLNITNHEVVVLTSETMEYIDLKKAFLVRLLDLTSGMYPSGFKVAVLSIPKTLKVRSIAALFAERGCKDPTIRRIRALSLTKRAEMGLSDDNAGWYETLATVVVHFQRILRDMLGSSFLPRVDGAFVPVGFDVQELQRRLRIDTGIDFIEVVRKEP